MKVILSLMYTSIYALHIISFDLLDNGDTIIPNSIFLLQLAEAFLFLTGSLLYAKITNISITFEKYLFLSGLIYPAFTFLSLECIQYTNASFFSNLEFVNIALTFVVELIMKTCKINNSIFISTIILSGVLANYGLIGVSPHANLYGYCFGVSTMVVENMIGVLIFKGGDNKVTNFLSFCFGLLTSSLIVFLIEYNLMNLDTFNNYAYLSIGSNGMYIFCYFFVVDKFGMVFDSVSCNLSIIITVIFVLMHNGVYNLFILILGDIILLQNSLYYIKVHE